MIFCHTILQDVIYSILYLNIVLFIKNIIKFGLTNIPKSDRFGGYLWDFNPLRLIIFYRIEDIETESPIKVIDLKWLINRLGR